MKKLTKLTAVLLAGIMSCPLVAVQAADEAETVINGWKIVYNEPTSEQKQTISGYVETDRETCYIAIDEDNARTGECAAKLVNQRAKKQVYTSLDLVIDDTSGFASGDYTFEFYAKGDFTKSGVFAGFGTDTNPKTGKLFALNNKKYTTEEGEDGWTKYSIPLTYTEGDAIHFNVTNGCTELYIDDVSIYGEDGVNLVENNGFESYEIIVPDPPMSATAKSWNGAGSYIVTNQDSYSGKNSLFMTNGGSDMTQTIKLVGGTQYYVSMYLKVEPTLTHRWMCKVFIGNEDPKSIGALGANVQHMNDTGWTVTDTEKPGWKKYEAVYSPALGSPLIHVRSQGTDAGFKVWLDDIVVYDIADEEKTNLVKNGGFEDCTLPEITDLSVEKSGYREVTASWTNPDLRGSSINVYVNDKKISASDLSAAASAKNSVVIPNALSGETYNVKVGIVYAGIEMFTEKSVTVEEIDYEISEFDLNYGEENIAAGGNTVIAKLTNYVDEPKNAELMVVVRKGSMIMAVNSVKVTAEKDMEATAKAVVNIPTLDDGDYTITAYLWNGFDGMEILSPSVVYGEVSE